MHIGYLSSHCLLLIFSAIFAKNKILKNLNKTYMSYLARKRKIFIVELD
nr:MAG TPA: hypothetical protein [Caudoviricetes sp.]